jgi:Questin oxidase-like
MQLSNTLVDLLDGEAAFDAEYASGLSNHRPMALLALARLGATDDRLLAFERGYVRRLQAAPPPEPWPAGDPWAGRLGDRAAWPVYRDLFQEWLCSEFARDVLNQALPRLMQGCGAAAFHGLIRTAYAVQAAHRRELADALAYWACRWLDLGAPSGAADTEAGGPTRTTDPETVLRQLRAGTSPAPLIFQRMQAAARPPAFQAAAGRLQVDTSTLRQLSGLAAMAYAASGNFTALHLVTSAHAMRVLLPFVDEPLHAVRGYWWAFAAAVCASGMKAGPAPAPRPWPELVAAALASDDDHVIKLVDSCRAEAAAYADAGTPGPWQQAATRAVTG